MSQGAPQRPGPPEPPGPPFLLDTHIWVWHLAGSERLPVGLRDAIEASSDLLWLSPISVWEIAMLHERGRVELEGGPRRWVGQALARLPLGEAALTNEVALRSHEVSLAHRDPADRLIAATAIVHDLTLLSVDDRLTGAPGVRIRSS